MSNCERCGKEAHHTHHIDHDHQNNDPDNLEQLCTLCHAKEHDIEPSFSKLRLIVTHHQKVQKTKNQIQQTMRSLRNIDIKPDRELAKMAEDAESLEKKYKKEIEKHLEGNELAEWMVSKHGIGYLMAGLILSEIDWEKTPSYASLWAYAGLAPDQVKRKGETANWNHRLKKYCYRLADCVVKMRTPKYRDIYDKEKEKQLGRDITRGHAHQRAMRKIAKVFLRDLFTEMRG